MSRKFILLDVMNLAFRAKHVVQGDYIDIRIGMALNVMFNSIRKVYEKYNADHLVMCLEGRSWRKDVYPEYKMQRKVAQLKKTVHEQQDDQRFLEGIEDFISFITEKTNATTLRTTNAEADDMISMWILSHPDDQHIIVSSDQDFYQLLSKNVDIYNGISETYITVDGIYDVNGKPATNSKGILLETPNPAYTLFKKCIRGDTSDNIFPAYPGVREKGSKNKVGIIQAFEDMDNKGYNWNNFFMQKWEDENGIEHTVRDKYEFNKQLIDLLAQPDNIKKECLLAISEAINKEPVSNIGIYFMKFCNKWEMKRISDYPHSYVSILKSRY